LQINPSLPDVLHIRDVALGVLEDRKQEAEVKIQQRREAEERERQQREAERLHREAEARERQQWEAEAERLRQEAEARERQRQAAAAERWRREAEASQSKPFTFEIITVDKYGKLTNKQSGKAYQKEEDLGKGVKLEMVYIPAGSFMMGSPSGPGEGDDNQRPQHQVTIAQPFYLGKYPITQEQWQAVMGNNPSHFKGAKLPVENVSWNDAVYFCKKLSRKTGKIYRLPSEAEWEYACRAGTITPFYFGETITPDLVNYEGNGSYGSGPKGLYREKTTYVGSFPPNAFGLYDMHGNVWEWCSDRSHSNYNGAPSDGSSWETGGISDHRDRRGGSWRWAAGSCRAIDSFGYSAGIRRSDIGFRVALASDLPASSSSAVVLASDLPPSPSEMRDLFIGLSVGFLIFFIPTIFIFNIFSFLFHLIFG